MDAFEAVSLPESLTTVTKKYFSVDEANRALTLVRRIVADIMHNYAQLCDLHASCRSSQGTGDLGEAAKVRQRYAATADHLSELNEELESVGCELKDYRLGLVDFPARFGGREVCLCWKAGEDRIEHWHELEDGFDGRRPVHGTFD